MNYSRDAAGRYLPAPQGECWCCGSNRPVQSTGKGKGLCRKCALRWQRRGWTGPGPGPEFTPAIERARDHQTVITRMSSRQAGARIHVSHRTVIRWRALLREAS